MDPAAWRKKKARLSIRDLAKRLGSLSPTCVYRWERGEREAPNSAALAYARVSDGEVVGEDLDRARQRFLRSQGTRAA